MNRITDYILMAFFVGILCFSCQKSSNQKLNNNTREVKPTTKSVLKKFENTVSSRYNYLAMQEMNSQFKNNKSQGKLEFSEDSVLEVEKMDWYILDSLGVFCSAEGYILPSRIRFNFLSILNETEILYSSFYSDMDEIEIIPYWYEMDQSVQIFGKIYHFTFPEESEDSIQIASTKLSNVPK